MKGKVILFCSLLLTSVVQAGEDAERFLNVHQWHGVVLLQVEEAYSGHREWNNSENYFDEKFSSNETWRYRLHTGDAMPAVVDRFAPEPSSNEATTGTDDKKEMKQAMRRGGMNPAMMAMIMQQMQQVQGGFGSIKEWSQSTVPLSSLPGEDMKNMASMGISNEKNIRFQLESRYSYHEEGPDTTGEWCVDDNKETYTADIQGNASVNLVINLQKQAYSFKWHVSDDPNYQKIHTFSRSSSCEPDRNEQGSEKHNINIMLPTWLKDPTDSEKSVDKVVFVPLPDSGMQLSGVRRFVVKRPNNKLWEDYATERHVTLKWAFVPADHPLPSLPE